MMDERAFRTSSCAPIRDLSARSAATRQRRPQHGGPPRYRRYPTSRYGSTCFASGVWPNYLPGVQFSRDPEALNQFFRSMTPNTGPFDGNVISDAVAQMYAYTGFPRSLNSVSGELAVTHVRGLRHVRARRPDRVAPSPVGSDTDRDRWNRQDSTIRCSGPGDTRRRCRVDPARCETLAWGHGDERHDAHRDGEAPRWQECRVDGTGERSRIPRPFERQQDAIAGSNTRFRKRREMQDVYRAEQWHYFFVMVGGGAAALAGLVSVRRDVTEPGHRVSRSNPPISRDRHPRRITFSYSKGFFSAISTSVPPPAS